MIRIFTPETQDEKFYAIMGQYFAHRIYAQEMGGWQFYNKDNATWFLLFDDGVLLGFCVLYNEKTHVFWDNFYILKQYRGQGNSRVLFDARLEYSLVIGKEIRAITDNPIQVHNYEKNKLEHYGQRGRYKKYRKVVSK